MTRHKEQVAAYVFGVVVLVALLIIAIAFPKPTPFQFLVFRVVLALATAGVAAMIPGFLNVQLGRTVRAGGAIAVFVVVYFFSPAGLVVDTDPGPVPSGDPREVAEEYLRVADSLDFERTWAAFGDTAKRTYGKAALQQAYQNVRVPLGAVIQRQLQGVQPATSLPGWPPAHFRAFAFVSLYSGGRTRAEQVFVMSEQGVWRIAGHTIQTTQ